MTDITKPLAIFDIETKPDTQLIGEQSKPFDPRSVKVGNIKDEAKISAKIEAARLEHKTNQNKYAALSPRTGTICAIGVHLEDQEEPTLLFGQEKDILEKFWHIFRHNEESDFGFYSGSNDSSAFDPMFIIRRSWACGVDVPYGVLNRKGQLNSCFIDLAKILLAGEKYPAYLSADMAVKHLGLIGDDMGFDVVHSKESLEQKYGVKGENFHEFVNTENHNIAVTYLINDLAIERAIADRITHNC